MQVDDASLSKATAVLEGPISSAESPAAHRPSRLSFASADEAFQTTELYRTMKADADSLSKAAKLLGSPSNDPEKHSAQRPSCASCTSVKRAFKIAGGVDATVSAESPKKASEMSLGDNASPSEGILSKTSTNSTPSESFELSETPRCNAEIVDALRPDTNLTLPEVDVPTESENDGECLSDGVSSIILQVSSSNALLLRFDSETEKPKLFVKASVPTDESEEGVIGTLTDIRTSLVAHDCDSSMISDKWIANHLRWVVWKLASIERTFSARLGGEYLTYSRVLQQLKGRFHKELIEGKRSSIRKVLNRDVAASRLMVLCVARITNLVTGSDEVQAPASGGMVIAASPTGPRYGLELTDGWHSVQASPDCKICDFIESGMIRVGTKLLSSSAVLVGGDDGIDPLDPSYEPSMGGSKAYLRITANATRLARWDTKLGFVAPSRKIVSEEGLLLVKRVSDILAGGGNIPLVDIAILRRYPVLYLEQRESSRGQSTERAPRPRVFTEVEEHDRRQGQEKQKQRMIEKLSEEVEQECLEVRSAMRVYYYRSYI
jgi:breast cancer 2 susceptibility protein